MESSADYEFYFEYKKNNNPQNVERHLVWVSPSKDKLEIVRPINEYVQLTKEDSTTFFKIITGEN